MNANMEKIKRLVKNSIGTHCSVMSKQGRKKIYFENCIIDSAYPEIFVIKCTDSKSKKIKTLSFSYTELLTKKVFLSKTKPDSDEKGA